MPRDTRDRRDRVLKRNYAFHTILQRMVDGYLSWAARVQDSAFSDYNDGAGSQDPEKDTYEITVVDVFRMCSN
jgi:hypothetical protein